MSSESLKPIVCFDYKIVPHSAPHCVTLDLTWRPVTRPPMLWRDEVLYTVQYIADIARQDNRPLYLAMSGGIDAELVAWALLEKNIPFRALSLRQSGGTNDHDLDYAVKFCKQQNIEHHIVEYDPQTFWRKYIEQGYKTSWYFKIFNLLILDTVQQMGGCAIIATGDQEYRLYDNKIGDWYPVGYATTLDWCVQNNTRHFPYFYLTTSELTASWLQHELIQLLTSNPDYYRVPCSWSIEKRLIYHALFPQMKRRTKYHGWENIKAIKDSVEKSLKNSVTPHYRSAFVTVDQMRRELGIR